MRGRRLIFLVVVLLVTAFLGACADRNVEVKAQGQIIVGGSVGKGL